jgi:hypothetical protein
MCPGASARRTARCAASRRLLRLVQARRRLLRLRRTSRCFGTSRSSSHGSWSTTSPTPCVRVPRHVARLVVDYFAHAARPGASARRAARRRLLRLRRTSGCLGTSRVSSSTTSSTPHVRVPRNVARLVIGYFAYAVCLAASARRQLRNLRRAIRCLGSSRGSSSTTSPTPRVRVPRHVAWLIANYFADTAHPGALAHHADCHRLLRPRRASGCLGSSSTTSPRAGSSSTTSPTPRVRVPRHVTRLVVDFFAYVARPSASARRAAHRRPCVVSSLNFSSFGRTGSCRAPDHSVSRLDYSVRRHSTCCLVALALPQPRRASRLLVSWQHRLYFEYATRHCDIVFRSHRVDHSSRLAFQTSRERQSHPQQLVGINYD